MSGELWPHLMSCEQGCFAWSFQIWLQILFVCLGAFQFTHNRASPAVAWLEWNDSTVLIYLFIFIADRARQEHECWHSQLPQSRIPLEVQVWCQRTNFQNLIAIPSRLLHRSIKRSKYRFIRHQDGKIVCKHFSDGVMENVLVIEKTCCWCVTSSHTTDKSPHALPHFTESEFWTSSAMYHTH